MRAPDSAEEPPSGKPRKKDLPRENAPEELDRIISRMKLAQHLKQNPVLKFLQVELLSGHTGPVAVPDVKSSTKMRHVVNALFTLLRDAGYALGAFEIKRVCDWDVEVWEQAITGMMDPLDVLVRVVKQATKPATSPHADTEGRDRPGAGRKRPTADDERAAADNGSAARATCCHLPVV
ncbi:unnamed protein product [Phytophthora fragariaefolia]|uniref:Unnamed protein product n=1 Tax=Phytophthora fragariaefolia TaxID=1490495 RepID=A0A9W6YMW0_9STRA|nr:unnamed protein product [Phytophthora fragariaefolia]